MLYRSLRMQPLGVVLKKYSLLPVDVETSIEFLVSEIQPTTMAQ